MTSQMRRFAERLTRLERSVRRGQSSPQLGTSSIENGGAIKDRGPDGTTYQWIGRQFDGTHTATQMNGPTPPAPTSPGASWSPGGINVSWDGMFETGALAPMDLLRVDVHILDDEHSDPLLYQPVGSLPFGQGGAVSVLTGPGEYYAKLVAWTTSGKFAVSEASNEVVVEALTVELPDPTDGLAPVDAPVVTGQAFGVGAVEFQWPEIDNEDDVRYRYWLSLTPGITATGEGDGWVFTPDVRISKVDGVQVPMDGTPVYIKVAAYDEDGVGPVSAEAEAVARAPEVDQFFALLVGALEIEASQIRGEFISADLALLSALQVGERLEINGETSVITIFANELDEAGERIPLIQLDPDGSTFRGRVIADDVSVLQGLIMQGELSQIAENAGLTIMAGVGSPTMPPGLSSTTMSASWPAVPTGFVERGACWDQEQNHYLRLLAPTSGSVSGTSQVERIDATGSVLSAVTLANVGGMTELDFNGICAIGGYYFVMVKGDMGSGDYWDIAKFSRTGPFVTTCPPYPGSVAYGVAWGGETSSGTRYHKGLSRPTIGLIRCAGYPGGTYYRLFTAVWVDSSDFSYASITNWDGPGVYGQRRTWEDLEWLGGMYASADGDPLDTNSANGKSLSFAYGNFVDGSPEQRTLWVGVGNQLRKYTYDGSAYYAKDTSWAITMSSNGNAINKNVTAGTLDLSSVHGGGSVRNIYSGHIQEANEKFWVTYANFSGALHTLDSPASSLAVPTGKYVQVALPPASEDIDSAKVYAALSTTGLPADALMYERLETLTPSRTMLLDPSGAAGANNPPTSNTFAGGTPGWLRSQTGDFELNGDGTGDWPHLRQLVMDDLGDLPVIQRGSISITPSAVNTWTTSIWIPFDIPYAAGQAPTVITNVASSATADMRTRTSGTTEYGFYAWLYASNTTARSVTWVAVGGMPVNTT